MTCVPLLPLPYSKLQTLFLCGAAASGFAQLCCDWNCLVLIGHSKSEASMETTIDTKGTAAQFGRVNSQLQNGIFQCSLME